MHKPKLKSQLAPVNVSGPVSVQSRIPVWLLVALLALVTLALYWPALHGDFVFDDELYVTKNFHVQDGLTVANLKWALLNPVAGNWHPLTVWSHMLDCQLFGLNPWGHHLINVLLHALNTVLVFFLLRQLTGATWRSFFVAALFGWHPLRVESVAWVAERKDVLSACFGLLSLLCYAKAVTGDKCQVTGSEKNILTAFLSRVTCHVSPYYFLSLFFFALGLMSKAMLVTWPFVMLLLDWWPLERFKVQGSRFKVQGLILEKVPFFALAAVMSMVTYEVQNQGGAVQLIENLPVNVRLGNALISYCRYLGKLFWPADLAVFYPHPGHWPMAGVMLACGPLVVVTMVLVMIRRRYPFLLMGWLWYIGTLVPVIGLVQVGDQAMADRYTYIPSVGVLILVVWGAYELTRRWRYQPTVLGVAGLVVVVLCLGMTRQQLGYWRDNESLFRHALAVTENNYLAHHNLGFALDDKGQTDAAINQYLEAIRLKPNFAKAYNNLGFIFDKQGRIDEAISQFLKVIRLTPNDAEAHSNLGNALLKKNRIDEAIRQHREAVRLAPDNANIHYNLAIALDMNGQTDEAITHFQEAIRLNPGYAEARNNLGIAFLKKAQIDEAIDQFQEVLRLTPNDPKAHNNLGIALLQKGKNDEAIAQFQEAVRLNPDSVETRNNLERALKSRNTPADH